MLVQRMLNDADQAKNNHGTSVTSEEILSRATFLSSILYDNRSVSSFEMVFEYTPSITGLLQTKLTEELVVSDQEQIDNPALSSMSRASSPQCYGLSDFSKNDLGYLFKRAPKFGV